MDKPDIRKNLDKSFLRFLIGMAVTLVSAPLAIIPILKLYNRNSPTNEFLIWLWNIAPTLAANDTSASYSKIITFVAFGIMLIGIYIAYSAHKNWEKMEKILEDAEKRVLIEDFLKKAPVKKK